MLGTNEAVQAEIRRVEDGLDGWKDDDMIAENREVLHPLLGRLQDRQRRRWRRGLKSDGHEDHLFVWVRPRYLPDVEARVHHPEATPSGAGIKAPAPAARHSPPVPR